MTRKVLGIFVLLLALLAIWSFLLEGDAAKSDAAQARFDPPELPAASEAMPTAVEALPADPLREPVAAPATAVDEAQVRVRFHDLLAGDLLTPRAVVLLEPEGKFREARLDADGSLLIPFAGPSVLAAAFAAHVPLLAVVRPEEAAADIHLQVYPSSRLTIEFEGCDTTALPANARIQLGLHSSASDRSRSDHGQSVMHGYTAHMVSSIGLPDLTLEPPLWFSSEQAAVWRSFMTEIRVTSPSPGPPVHAVMLLDWEGDRAVTGQPLTWELAPAGCDLSWRTELPLQQLEPEASVSGTTLATQKGERWGMFQAGRGEARLLLAWAAASSVMGRVPSPALTSELMAPSAVLYSIVRGQPSSPPNGQLRNQVDGTVDLVDGGFRFDDLPPGEYQVNAAWAIGQDVFLSGSRVLLAAGQERDLGLCPVRPGAPVRLDLRLRDLEGNPLHPEQVFLANQNPRHRVSINNRVVDPLEPSIVLVLDLPYLCGINVHGMWPGFIHLSSFFTVLDPAALKEGVQFIQFVPNGERLTFPEEVELTIQAEFLVGTVPTTLQIEFPDGALDRSYDLYLTHLSSGTKIPTHTLRDLKRPRARTAADVLDLAPGEYEALVLRNGGGQAQPGEVHHYAFRYITVEADGRPITLKMEAGVEAQSPANAHELRTTADSAFFMLRSIGGVELKARCVIVGNYQADGSFRLHGVPQGAVLQQNRNSTSWVVNEAGLLVPLR